MMPLLSAAKKDQEKDAAYVAFCANLVGRENRSRLAKNPSGDTNAQLPASALIHFSPVHGNALIAKPRSHQALTRLLAIAIITAADRLAIAAPAILRRVTHQACAHRIQVNICRCRPRRSPILHDHAFVTIKPQDPRSAVQAIEPFGKAFEQRLHKLAQIMHPPGVAATDFRQSSCSLFLGRGRYLRVAKW